LGHSCLLGCSSSLVAYVNGYVNAIRSFHSIYNVVNRGVLQAMWGELAGKVGHRDQLIIC